MPSDHCILYQCQRISRLRWQFCRSVPSSAGTPTLSRNCTESAQLQPEVFIIGAFPCNGEPDGLESAQRAHLGQDRRDPADRSALLYAVPLGGPGGGCPVRRGGDHPLARWVLLPP